MTSSDRLLFVDVETTGLTHADRVVTLGWVEIGPGEHAEAMTGHMIFNPGRPNNPFAAAVHGYDDWTLRHQEDFCDHAEVLIAPFQRAGRIFAHNASFDERFLRTEFAAAGLELAPKRFDCTMRAYKTRHARPGGLDKVLDHMGLPTRGKQHGALEDAWFCMSVWRWLEGLPPLDMPDHLSDAPSNWIEPEAKPIRGARSLLWR